MLYGEPESMTRFARITDRVITGFLIIVALVSLVMGLFLAHAKDIEKQSATDPLLTKTDVTEQHHDPAQKARLDYLAKEFKLIKDYYHQ